MIWDHDKYWEASPGSTLKGFNNGLTIFYDLDEIFNKIWASCKISLKLRIWVFFEKYRKSTSGLIGSFWYVRKWKKHVQMMFPWCYHDWKIFEMKQIFQLFRIFLCYLLLSLFDALDKALRWHVWKFENVFSTNRSSYEPKLSSFGNESSPIFGEFF